MKNTNLKKLSGILGVLFFLVLNAFFLRFNAFRAFIPYDMGSFLDASWRIYKGQIPFQDFIFTTGPIHLYMTALFFFFFGFSKLALLVHLITISSVVIMATYMIAKKYSSIFISLIVTMLSTACFYWSLAFPLYDHSTHFWGVLAVALVWSQLPLSSNSNKNNFTAFVCGILIALAFMTKSNVGFSYAAVFFILFSLSKDIKLVGYYIAGGVLVLGLLFIFVFSSAQYYDQSFTNFALTKNTFFQIRRFTYPLAPVNWLRGYYWLIVLPVLWSSFSLIKELREELVLLLGIFFVAIMGMLTGSMLQESNIMLQGVIAALAFGILTKTKNISSEKEIKIRCHRSALFLTVLVFGLTLHSIVYGFELKPWTYVGDPFGNYALKAKPLQGWMLKHEDGEDIDGMVKFIKEEVKPNQSLLVLTDMQILYPLTGRDSYKGIPFFFHENYVPAPGKQVELVRKKILENPPDWIITHRFKRSFVTFIVQYLELRNFVVEGYDPVKSWHNYAILKRK